jgi:tryptophanase
MPSMSYTAESQFKTVIEPHRIKVVEPLRMTSRSEREQYLREADYNLFRLRSDHVLIDLLTDSGTSAMSSEQWAGIQRGDESYAGSRSYFRFESVVTELTGHHFVLPTHQGRAAERILFSQAVKPGQVVPNNTHFDTTRANIEFVDGEAVDIVIEEGRHPASLYPFKGNMDVDRLVALIEERGAENVALVMITITNNSGGGQPVSMQNLRDVRAVCDKFGLALYLDAARFAENAYFIKLREEEFRDTEVTEIARQMFALADGCTMSAKKDGLVNIGGFVTTNDEELAKRMRSLLILTEGFPTYGGLAGRDLEAMAQGLVEVLDENYLAYRIRSTAYLGEKIAAAGVPIVQPPGGHAVYIDAAAMLPLIPPLQYPGLAVACELYLAGGVRSCEIGSVMFGSIDADTGKEQPASMELVRLAIPRRVYSQSHIDYVAEVVLDVQSRKDSLPGMRITAQDQYLRHFTGKFAPLS